MEYLLEFLFGFGLISISFGIAYVYFITKRNQNYSNAQLEREAMRRRHRQGLRS